jgi:hypothetical protein
LCCASQRSSPLFLTPSAFAFVFAFAFALQARSEPNPSRESSSAVVGVAADAPEREELDFLQDRPNPCAGAFAEFVAALVAVRGRAREAPTVIHIDIDIEDACVVLRNLVLSAQSSSGATAHRRARGVGTRTRRS